jgi:iron(III) transport system substrate-binding protein
MMKYLPCLLALVLFDCSGSSEQNTDSGEAPAEEQVINVYSHRHYDVDKLVFDRFTEETGIKVNVVKAGADELITRLETEGDQSPADVLITVDALKLNRAKQMGLLQPVEAATNNQDIFIEEERYWYGITYRARVIVYDKEDVDVSAISSYQDLAADKWKNRVLVRSSSSGYNQSLLASIIHAEGPEKAKAWAKGIAANMAQDPKGGDRDQIKAIASGVGDLAIVNTYYLGLLLNSENEEEVKAGQAVGIFFPNQGDRGSHINISGIGVTKYAPNKENAIKLIEFLTSDEIQKIYTANSYEYPVSKNVEPDATIAAWGNFKVDNLDYAKDTKLNEQAVKIFEEVGWN